MGVVPGPLCGPDKVRKLRLEWEEAQPPEPFPTGGGLGTAEPGRRDHSLYGNGMGNEHRQPLVTKSALCGGWAMGAQTFPW